MVSPAHKLLNGVQCLSSAVLSCHLFAVGVYIYTTESATSGMGGGFTLKTQTTAVLYWSSGSASVFKARFPETTRLARAVLGAVISAEVFDR